MKNRATFYVVLVAALLVYSATISIFPSVLNAKGWTHLEIGAGNYGDSASSIYAFKSIFDTIDEIIATRGSEGTIYINDINTASMTYAAAALSIYLDKRYGAGSLKVTIMLTPGDIFIIPIPSTESVHLKSPDIALIGFNPYQFGNKDVAEEAARRKIETIRNLARRFKVPIDVYTASNEQALDDMSRLSFSDFAVKKVGKSNTRYLSETGHFSDEYSFDVVNKARVIYRITNSKIDMLEQTHELVGVNTYGTKFDIHEHRCLGVTADIERLFEKERGAKGFLRRLVNWLVFHNFPIH